MHYHGGKAVLSKYLAPFINDRLNRLQSGYKCYIESFLGGCNFVDKIQFDFAVLNDINLSLINMYRALQKDWIPPTDLSEDQYYFLRDQKDPERPETAFASFGCSFGGKEWGGYARGVDNKGKARNYAMHAHKKLMRLKDVIQNKKIKFICEDYLSVIDSANYSVIYCDPPYENTLKYKTGSFDNNKFLNDLEKNKRDNYILLSEFSNPRNYNVIYKRERAINMKLTKNATQERKTELLLEI
jgi:DNA adenine methylase